MATLLQEHPVLTGIVGNPPHRSTGQPGFYATESNSLKRLITAEFIDSLRRAIQELPESPDYPLRTVFCYRLGLRFNGDEPLRDCGKLTDEQIGELYGWSRAWANKLYMQACRQVALRLPEWGDIEF